MNLNLLRLQRIRAVFAHEPLAILNDAVQEIVARVREYDFTTAGVADLLAEPSAEALDAYYEARSASGGSRSRTVAVVPVLGPISKRDSFMSMFVGGTSTTRLSAMIRQLAADESVGTILLNVDSPGGTVSGLPELAADIRKARETKPVVAIANDLCASAAYWIASQADEIVATPESLTGSIGIFTAHADCSKAMEEAGVKTTYIYAGRYKVEGNPDEPLSDEAKAHIQSIIDSAYALFVNDVAAGRGVKAAEVRADYGEGRVLTARSAKAAGMVDRIASYNETIARLAGSRPIGARAEDDQVVTNADGDEFTQHTDGSITVPPGFVGRLPDLPESAYDEDAQILAEAAERAEPVIREPRSKLETRSELRKLAASRS